MKQEAGAIRRNPLPACVADDGFWREGGVGESRGEGKGLDRSPCSLASAQRGVWEEDEDLDWRKEKRRNRSDSRWVKKSKKALKKERKKSCKRTKTMQKKSVEKTLPSSADLYKIQTKKGK